MAAPSREQSFRQIMSGAARGPAPMMLRALLGAVEPFYAAGVCMRNAAFDRKLRRQHCLGRPVISVGNITTGGTGKTPVVQWIIRQLLSANRHPAILLRGYKSSDDPEGKSDEALLLARSLNVPVRANPDRVAASRLLLEEHPRIDVLILDDGFQHRQAARDFDLVLIDATNPFGYSHILPRGLLREPLTGLNRADALLVTRTDQVHPDALAQIERDLRRYNSAAPILYSTHAIVGFAANGQTFSSQAVRGKKIFTFCGIGNPRNFHRQLLDLGIVDCGLAALDDHHAYSLDDINRLKALAAAAGAEVLITTEKDWVKLERLANKSQLPIWRAQLEIQFPPAHAAKLREMIEAPMSKLS